MRLTKKKELVQNVWLLTRLNKLYWNLEDQIKSPPTYYYLTPKLAISLLSQSILFLIVHLAAFFFGTFISFPCACNQSESSLVFK